MALDKIDFSSIFGDRIGGIDFINDLITGDNANEMGVENSNGIKTETMDFSGETNQVNIPATGSSTGPSNTETGTTSNMPITESNGSVMNSQATNTNATTNQMQSNSGVGFGQQQNQNTISGPYATNQGNAATGGYPFFENNQTQSTDLNNNQMANNESQIGPQQVKITETEQEEKKEVSNNSTGGSGSTGGSSSTSGETTDSNVSSMSTNSATGEKGENKEGTETKGEVAETGKDIQKDLRTRTQYQYDVEENSRKDSVDSAMKEAGLEEGEFDKYIDILEKTIKSEEDHIQFSEENELRLVRLYGKKDNATGKYPNAKELLDIIYSKDPNKKINFMPLTGKDSEKRTEEIWEEIYEDAKTTYKDNKIFQKESYKKLTEEEKTEFIKELAKEKIKTAYQEERKSVYENNNEIDIEGNKGGLGLYKAKDFDSLTEEEKIEFIGRKCNHREGQLTFSTDEVKEWGDGNEYQDDYINGMTDSIADRKISVKQLKYMKKEVEMQKEIYKYEKIVYTDDYKNYTEKGTIGTITTTDTHGALRTISEDIYKDKKKYLNSEQNKILDYIYNKEGKEKADEYIHALRGQIAKGQGIEQANEFLKELESDSEKMNTFMEVMKDKERFDKCLKEGTLDGIESFGEGVKNFFSDDCELSALEWKEQAIMSVLSKNTEYSRGWCDKAYQFGNVVGNLAPSMLASAAVTTATGGAGAPAALGTIFNTTGELAGSLAMMISAAGSAKHQALVNGAGTAEAWAYGICSGLSEATMERFLGAIPGLSRLEGGYFKKIISEGIEEGSQEFVSAMLNSVILGEDIDIGDLLEQAKESFGMGSAVSAVLNVGSLKKSNVKLKYNGKTIKISESTREKIQEQIGKVNEGEIDVEVGNQNAIDLLETEIKKQVGKTENIDAKEVENIEVKEESNNIKEIANEEKIDKISESEDKITKERADEKDSKELYEMDSKLKKAAQDIKKINKQEKQEKKEAKKLEKVKTKQERVRITDEISLDENSSLEEVNKAIREDTVVSLEEKAEIKDTVDDIELIGATSINGNFNGQISNMENSSSGIKQYRISDEYKPYYKLEELLTSKFQKKIGDILVVSTTKKGLKKLLKNTTEQIKQIEGSYHGKILVTDVLLSPAVENKIFNISRVSSLNEWLAVIIDPISGKKVIDHEFGHLKSRIIDREIYPQVADLVNRYCINQTKDKAMEKIVYNAYQKMLPKLAKMKEDIVFKAKKYAEQQLNYDDIKFENLSIDEKLKINSEYTRLKLQYMDMTSITSVIDIWDAITGGEALSDLRVGHGEKYYSNGCNIIEELIAQYSTLIENDALDKYYEVLPDEFTNVMKPLIYTMNSKIKANRTVNKTVNKSLKSGDIQTVIENINYMSENEKAIAVNEAVDNLLNRNKLEDAYNIVTKTQNSFALQKVAYMALKTSETMLQSGNYDKALKYATMSNNLEQVYKVTEQIHIKIGNLISSKNIKNRNYKEALRLANIINNVELANLVNGYINIKNGDIYNAMEMLKKSPDCVAKNNLYNEIYQKAKNDIYNALNAGNIKLAEAIVNIVENSNLTSEFIIYKEAIAGNSDLAIESARVYGNQNILNDVISIIKDRAKREYRNRNYELASSLASSINYGSLQQKINRKLRKIGSKMTRVEVKNIDEMVDPQQQAPQQQYYYQPQQQTGPQKDSFIVLSDFHGANWVLDKVQKKYMSNYETIYNLGDITDRGKEPFKLLLDYMELSKENPDKFIYVPGNHDSFIYGSYMAINEEQRSIYRNNLTRNGGLKTLQQMEELRTSNPAKFNELLDWLGSQPLQRYVIKNGKKYAMAHALFNQTIYTQNPNYSLKDYMRDVTPGQNSSIRNILWFRKGQSNYNPADLPSTDTTMIIGHTPNANNLDLNGVRIIDVDGAACRQNSDGTYSTRKYTGGDDYEVTVRLDDESSEVVRVNNFMANFQSIQPTQNYTVQTEYTAPYFDIDTELSTESNKNDILFNQPNFNKYFEAMKSSNLNEIFNDLKELADLLNTGHGAFIGKIENEYKIDAETILERIEDKYDKISLAQLFQYDDYVEKQISSIKLNDSQLQKYNKLLSINSELNRTINLKILDSKYDFLEPILDLLTISVDLQYRIVHMSTEKLKILELCYKKLQKDNIYTIPFISSIVFSLETAPFTNPDAVYKCNFSELNSSLEKLIKNGYILTDEEIDKLIYLYEAGEIFNVTNIDELRTFDNYDSKYQKKCRKEIDIQKKSDTKNIDFIKRFVLLRTYGIDKSTAQKLIERYDIDDIKGYDVLEQYKALKRIIDEDDADTLIKLFEMYDEKVDTKTNYYRMASFNDDMKKMYAKEINKEMYKLDKKDYVETVDGVPIYEVNDEFKMLVTSVSSYSPNAIISDYNQHWNRKKIISHRGCFSIIGNNYFSTAKVRSTLFGFSTMDEKMLLGMRNRDMDSAGYSAKLNEITNGNFMNPSKLLSTSRNGYNELIYERKDLDGNGSNYKKNPDYILYIEESIDIDAEIEANKNNQEMVEYLQRKKQEEEHLYTEAIKAAKDFGIPLVKINRENFAIKATNKINNLLHEFENTKNKKILSEIITILETNRSGTLGQMGAKTTDSIFLREKYFSKEKAQNIHKRILSIISSIPSKSEKDEIISVYKKAIQKELLNSRTTKSISSSVDYYKLLEEFEKIK